MLYEYECKIINIPITELRNKIEKNGGKRIHSSVLFRRYLFHLPNKNQNGFIRLRSEGRNRVTLTCKIFNSHSKYPKEDEIELKNMIIPERKTFLDEHFVQCVYSANDALEWFNDYMDKMDNARALLEKLAQEEKEAAEMAKSGKK